MITTEAERGLDARRGDKEAERAGRAGKRVRLTRRDFRYALFMAARFKIGGEEGLEDFDGVNF